MKRHRRRRTLAPYLFLAPSLLCVSLFVLLPFLDAVRRSFYSAMSGQFVGLQNYRTVLHNAAFRLAVGNTLRFTLLCIPVLVALALLLALLLQAAKDGRGVYKTTFLAPVSYTHLAGCAEAAPARREPARRRGRLPPAVPAVRRAGAAHFDQGLQGPRLFPQGIG